MRELEMALKAITTEVDSVMDEMVKTPKKSPEYQKMLGKLEAYMDVQNMLMWRINVIQKGE